MQHFGFAVAALGFWAFLAVGIGLLVCARLHQPYGWSGLAHALVCSSRAAVSGLVLGIVAPFRLRSGHIGLMTVSAAALLIWVTLQGA